VNLLDVPVYEPGKYNTRLEPWKHLYPPDGLIHAYLWWAGEVVYAAPSYHLGAILPTIAHEASRRGYRLGVSGDPLRLWTCLIGGSGSGKSTAHRMARDFYDDYVRQIRGPTYRKPFLHLAGSIQGVKHALASGYHDPLAGRVVAVLETDELTRFLPRRGASVAEDLCQLFDGRPIEDHTRTAQKAKQEGQVVFTELNNYVVSALFATTASSLDAVADEQYFTGGLFSRILWISGRVDPTQWTPGPIDWQAVRRATALDRWEQWSQWADGYEARGGARLVHMLAEAQEVYKSFALKHRNKCFDSEGGRFAPVYMRGVADHVLKIAALFAFSCEDAFDLNGGTGVYVSAADMQAAAALVENAFESFTKVATTVGVDRRARTGERIEDLLREAGARGMTRAEIWERMPPSDRVEVEPALAMLVANGRVEGVTVHNGKRGRPPTYLCLTHHLDELVQRLTAEYGHDGRARFHQLSGAQIVSIQGSENANTRVEKPSNLKNANDSEGLSK